MEAKVNKKSHIELLVSYLESYRGRDKIIRLCNYALYFASGSLKRMKGKDREFSIGKLAAELSNLRVMLRLLDDLAMLHFTFSYGTGSSEKDLICRAFQLAQNCFDQLYYPLEHIAWARDTGILKGNSSMLWTLGSFCWVISLSLGILMYVRKLLLLRKHSERNAHKESIEAEHDSKYEKYVTEENRKKSIQLKVGLIGNLADLINGINWLPNGILWASKLPDELVGIFGVISTLCSIYNSTA